MIIAQATLVCKMDMFHADNMRRVNGLINILFSDAQTAISLFFKHIMVTYVTD